MEIQRRRIQRDKVIEEEHFLTHTCTQTDLNLFGGFEESISFDSPSIIAKETNWDKRNSKDEENNRYKEHSYGKTDDWSLGMPFAVDTMTRMKTAIRTLCMEFKSLVFETDGLRQQIGQRDRQNNELQTKIIDLMDEKKKEEKRNEWLKSQNKRKDLEIIALKKRTFQQNAKKINYYSHRQKQRDWIKATVQKLMTFQGTNMANSNSKKRNTAKPDESKNLKKQIAQKDQDIQNLKTQNSSLQSQIDKKDHQIQELKVQLENLTKEQKDCEAQKQVQSITEDSSKTNTSGSEKEIKRKNSVDARSIAVEALSSLHFVRLTPGPSVSTKIEDPVSNGEIEKGETDLPEIEFTLDDNFAVLKKPLAKKPHQRTVQNGYFRWTRERNIQLINAMIETLSLSPSGQHRMKESEFLRKVWERCGNLGAENKIRDNVNNLLRRYLYIHGSEKSIADVKADPEEYKKLLEAIRRSLENSSSAFGVDALTISFKNSSEDLHKINAK